MKQTGEAIPNVQWEYDAEAFTMTADGVFTAIRPGCYTITAGAQGYTDARADIVVHSSEQFVLPADVTTVEAEAFSGTGAVEIVLPDGVESIGEGAFADCAGLLIVSVPDSVTRIAQDAFDAADEALLTILCSEGSAAHEFAMDAGLKYLLLP